MEYQDKIYGKVEINEPVILDLMNSPSIQRLRGVNQHGRYAIYFPHDSISRFDHSVGVFILLKKFGAPLLEQIAGLLHDVSHTAFSHVADYIFRDGSGRYQNFQDEELDSFIKRSEIPEILEKYDIDCKEILDDSKFPLEERDLPDLCADRIDYFLRDGLAFRVLSKKQVDGFLENLTVVENTWVFKDKGFAQKYARLYLDVNNKHWSGVETAVELKSMGELMKNIMKKGDIKRNDLFATDEEVWEKVLRAAAGDKSLELLLDRAENKYNYKVSDKSDYDICSLCKSRVVDPLFLDKDGELVRISSVDKEFVELKNNFSKPKEYYIKFLEPRK